MIPDISSLITAGALFVSNHSGGKDSQAMLINLLEVIPPKQLLVVHASLGVIEWPGALELAETQAGDAGLSFIVARASKTFSKWSSVFKLKATGEFYRPEAERLENLFPASAPCNLLKTSYSLEMFRKQVSLQVERGRKSSMNFRTAERFGLIEAVEKPVVFWFEKYQAEGANQ